jgi:hypothetical protein
VGTSAAVNCANLHMGLLEVTRLLPRFRMQLLFCQGIVDDGIGVWLCHDPLVWAAFLNCLNTWGLLKWTSNGLTDEIMSMDLAIRIDRFSNYLTYERCQKAKNMHLCIPPNSAHPQRMLRSLAFGRMRACWCQNTEKKKLQEWLSH